MIIGIVGPMTSCMKGQGIYKKFKVKYNKNGTLHSIIPLEEKTSTLMVDSEEEDVEEVWVKLEVISFVITAHIQVIWQGTVRTLVPLAVTVIHLNMS
jgi:ATP-dependent RNA circularization protein (DNA/RNA ligase family)